MNTKPGKLALLALAGLLLGGGVAGIYEWRQASQETPQQVPDPYSQLPDFSLPNIEGGQWHAEQWRNKILVINFWASWCPPCRKEMPMFVRLQEEFAEQGVLFVGIAIDDEQAARDFIDTYGIEFPVLLGEDRAMDLSRQLGNRFQALPYTVVANGGNILHRQAGEVLESELRPLLEKLIQPR
ncbi:TlpA family protein disulfide reductase [Thiolapillus sp.]